MRVAYPAHLKLIKFLHVGRVFPARGFGGRGGGGVPRPPPPPPPPPPRLPSPYQLKISSTLLPRKI